MLERLALRRSRSNLALLALVVVGSLVAAVLLAGAPMYLRSLERLAVVHELDSLGAAGRDIWVSGREIPLTRASFQEATAGVGTAAGRFGSMLESTDAVVRSPALWLRPPAAAPTGDPAAADVATGTVRTLLQQMTGFSENVRYVAGRAPERGPGGGPDTAVVEAALGFTAAQVAGIAVGDELQLSPGRTGAIKTRAVVTGLFVPKDSEGRYWLDLIEPLLRPDPPSPNEPAPVVLMLAENAIYDIPGAGPLAIARGWWLIHLNRDAIERERPAQITSAVDRFRTGVAGVVPDAFVSAQLGSSFAALERRVIFARVPVYVVGAVLIILAFGYLAMTSGLLAQRMRSQAALLRSRGIVVTQVFRIYAVDMAIVLAVSVPAGPFLAALTISRLGASGAYRSVTGGAALPVELGPQHFLFAALAALIPITLLTLSATAGESRNPAIDARAATRPEGRPVFQRLFLDVGLLALGAAALWELQARGGFVFADPEGGRLTSVTLLVAPTVITLGGTLVILRLLPVVMTGIGRLAGMFLPPTGALGFWYLARRPFQHSWLFVLLALAAGLSVLSATISSTLERSSDEQVLYRTAGDLRISDALLSDVEAADLVGAVRAIPGVRAASRVLRTTARAGTTEQAGEFTLLAVEPEEFARASWYRNDFSERSLGELLRAVKAPAPPPPAYLPEGSRSVGLWVNQAPADVNLEVWIRVRSADGETRTLATDGRNLEGWQYRVASIPRALAAPIEVISILTYEPVQGDSAAPVRLMLDDLQAELPGGRRSVVEPFESLSAWAPLPTSEGMDTALSSVPEDAAGPGPHRGDSVALLELGRGSDSGIRGIYRSSARGEIPIIASIAFLDATGLRVGDSLVGRVFQRFLPLKIEASARLFPTLAPERGGFAVASMSAVLDYLNLRGPVATGAGAEVVVAVDDEAYKPVLAAIRQLAAPRVRVEDRRALQAASLVDPLAVAGWRGVTAVSFALTVLFTLAGVGTYMAIVLRDATPGWAVLRALGFRRRNFAPLAAVEHLLLAFAGAGAGAAAGLLTSRLTVTAMSHTATGDLPLPPFVLVTQWGWVSAVLAAAAFSALVALGAAFIASGRLSLHTIDRHPA